MILITESPSFEYSQNLRFEVFPSCPLLGLTRVVSTVNSSPPQGARKWHPGCRVEQGPLRSPVCVYLSQALQHPVFKNLPALIGENEHLCSDVHFFGFVIVESFFFLFLGGLHFNS